MGTKSCYQFLNFYGNIKNGTWILFGDRLAVMVVDKRGSQMRVLIEGVGDIPVEDQQVEETIFVVFGDMINEITGKVYYPGASADFKPGDKRKLFLNGMALCCINIV